MHQQEVGGVLLLSHHLGHTGRHRHGGHAGRADQRIDLATSQNIHQIAQQQAASSGQQESRQTQSDNGQGLNSQEAAGRSLKAHGQAQRNRHDIDQSVLSGIRQTLRDTTLTEQVAQHEHTNQRCSIGDQQHYEDGHGNGEDDLLSFGDHTQLTHLDLTHFLSGHQLHQRGLDHGDQGHVRVCRDGNSRQQLYRQF